MSLSGLPKILGYLRLLLIVLVHHRRKPAIELLHPWLVHRRHAHMRKILRIIREMMRLLMHRIHMRRQLLLVEARERMLKWDRLEILLVTFI